MAQKLGAMAALAAHLGLVPRTHMVVNKRSPARPLTQLRKWLHSSSYRGPNSLPSSGLQEKQARMWHRHWQTITHIKIVRKNVYKIKILGSAPYPVSCEGLRPAWALPPDTLHSVDTIQSHNFLSLWNWGRGMGLVYFHKQTHDGYLRMLAEWKSKSTF